MAKRKKTPTDPDFIVKLMTIELKNEGDRALAILAAAYLDYLLVDLIVSAMSVKTEEVNELLFEGGNAPLGTFSSRINMAYCLGLLNEDQKHDLHFIRHIRNDFAHKFIEISSFETSSIADRCKLLKSAMIDGQPSTARECYLKSSVRLIVDIILETQNKIKKKPN